MVITTVQDYIAAGQFRSGEQLIEAQNNVRPGTILVFLEPLYKGGLDGVTPGSSCIVNAYTSNHEEISAKDTPTSRKVALHVVDGVGLVHALLLHPGVAAPDPDAGVQRRPLNAREKGEDRMGSRQLIVLIVTFLATLHVMSNRVEALDLNGAWVSDADKCAKVFERKGSQLGFTEMSDVYGGGFIIDGDRIIGKFAHCRIKTRKDSGANVNLIAACATDMMLSSVQFSLKELDANSLVRLFPGMDDMEIRYQRCPAG